MYVTRREREEEKRGQEKQKQDERKEGKKESERGKEEELESRRDTTGIVSLADARESAKPVRTASESQRDPRYVEPPQ